MLVHSHDGHALLVALDLGQWVVESNVPLTHLPHQVARQQLALATALHVDSLDPSRVLTPVRPDHGVARGDSSIVDR